jgi:hypothetical protein
VDIDDVAIRLLKPWEVGDKIRTLADDNPWQEMRDAIYWQLELAHADVVDSVEDNIRDYCDEHTDGPAVFLV